mgnify:CR=1 FL=1
MGNKETENLERDAELFLKEKQKIRNLIGSIGGKNSDKHDHAINILNGTFPDTSCYGCGSADHKFSEKCPLMVRLQKNPRAAKHVSDGIRPLIGDKPNAARVHALLTGSSSDSASPDSAPPASSPNM